MLILTKLSPTALPLFGKLLRILVGTSFDTRRVTFAKKFKIILMNIN